MEQCTLCKLGIEQVRWIDDGEEIAMGRNEDGIYELITVSGSLYPSRQITAINFCPKCGRRLNEGMVEDESYDVPKPSVDKSGNSDGDSEFKRKQRWVQSLSEDLQEEYTSIVFKSLSDSMAGTPYIVTLQGNGITQFEIHKSAWGSFDSLVDALKGADGGIKADVLISPDYVSADDMMKAFELKYGWVEQENNN